MSSPLDRRRAGILLHPTSLPGPGDNGTLGASAYRFVDFLVEAGLSVWQVLPLVPTMDDRSPYLGLSSHAGNPRLIDIPLLADEGWLDHDTVEAYRADEITHEQALRKAGERFWQHAVHGLPDDFGEFTQLADCWLNDFAGFMAFREHFDHKPWWQWPGGAGHHDARALIEAESTFQGAIAHARFQQYVFWKQWRDLKQYANKKGVWLFGDLPIYVAHDSADVWASPQYFHLNPDGTAKAVSGVPPDYFSKTGQRWGNPVYRWGRMKADGFSWWVRRMQTQLELYDLVRIDHFRGFEAFWSIPAECETAIHGHWEKAPGEALLTTLAAAFERLPLVAEDLGFITEEVHELRTRFELPGMKVLQFAFGGDADNPYLPHNYTPNSVVYTGTHDNNTTLGWYEALDDKTRGHIEHYLGAQADADMPWPLIGAAMASVSRLAMVPLQDFLALDGEHRMNQPGVCDGNWRWRFQWEQIPDNLAERIADMLEVYGRAD